MKPRLNPAALDKLEGIRDGSLPYPPMWETVPVRLVDYDAGRVTMTTRADARHVNALGTVHGGFAATVLDTVLGLTVFTSIDARSRHTTVDLAVKLVRPLPLDTELLAEGHLVHVSRSVGVSQGVLRDAAGIVFAHGTTTCHIKPAAE